jgi:hypothetical protein
MKKIALTIATLMICAAAMVGCGSDPVADDLINYINNEVPVLGEMESEASAAYEAVAGENYTDDATMAAALSDVVIPTSDELVEAANALTPATEEVAALHEIFISAVTERNAAFKMLLTALEEGDATKVDEFNAMMENADAIVDEFGAALDILAEEHGVE